uniref:Uncharacterized protein n=1 Tax=Aegilops tauschii subsp. strangulata TaxID=200361 RepID=A0A453RPL3_AEGTS
AGAYVLISLLFAGSFLLFSSSLAPQKPLASKDFFSSASPSGRRPREGRQGGDEESHPSSEDGRARAATFRGQGTQRRGGEETERRT